MRVAVRDYDSLKEINALDVVSYLESQGWTRGGGPQVPSKSLTFVRIDAAGSFEVAVPLDTAFRDYGIRMAEILRTLEAIEDRSQLEILKDIITSSVDLIRVRPDVETWPDGSIMINHGNALLHQSREMLLAAACATVKPSKVFPPRRPPEALDYMRRARLGQTEHGSFVLTILSPVNPQLSGQLSLFRDELPFERQVTETLFRSLAAAREAAIETMATNRIERFGDAVPQGVSANLCEAIASLHREIDSRLVSFKMTWARVRRPSSGIEDRVDIDREVVPVIEEGGKWLKATAPLEHTNVEGVPMTLRHAAGAAERTIIVPTLVDGKLRKVRISLSESEYDKAIRAHQDESFIRCEGILTREGRNYTLQEPSPIEIVEDSDA